MPRRSSIRVSVRPYEVVFGAPRLQVLARLSLDPAIAKGAIVLDSGPSAIVLSNRKRTATVTPIGESEPGWHSLTVGELVSATGKRLTTSFVVPFFVSDSRAKISSDLCVQSLIRLRIERLGSVRVSSAQKPKGAYIEVMKAVHRLSGRPIRLAFDHRGNRIDAAIIFQKIIRRRKALFGKLHPTLKTVLDRCRANQLVSIAVWLAEPKEGLPEKRTRGYIAKPPRVEVQRTARIAELAQGVVRMLRVLGAVELRPDPVVPVVFCKVAAGRIAHLQKSRHIAAIFLHETKSVLDLVDSMAIARSDQVQAHLGLTGAGVNVAVYEDGPDTAADLSITAAYLSSPATSKHARHTHGIIKNTQAGLPNGHASGCNLHSANSSALAAISWAAHTRGCTVISQSFHRDSEETSGDLSFDDIYKDYIALHWPYPTILQAAGNGPITEFVNHKGYNSLTVGNHDDTATTMSPDSVFLNPSTLHGDRELPELAANGTAVTTVGLTLSGTSMAAPAVAGCTALLQEANATLKSWPEGCRAILLAGANRNITGDTWWNDRNAGVDGSDGAGAVDALESVRIAQKRRTRDSAATMRGWDVANLRSADFGTSGEAKFKYYVKVPQDYFKPSVKVALAWDSAANPLSIGFPSQSSPTVKFGSDYLELDLDLAVFDSRGTLAGYSGSWDNSYEIAEFTARPGETYTIKISRWSGTVDVWFGIAWTVRGQVIITEWNR